MNKERELKQPFYIFSNVVGNIVIFIPLGTYLSLLKIIKG